MVLSEHQTAANHLRTVNEAFSKGSVQINTFPQTKQYQESQLVPFLLVGNSAASTAVIDPAWVGPALM